MNQYLIRSLLTLLLVASTLLTAQLAAAQLIYGLEGYGEAYTRSINLVSFSAADIGTVRTRARITGVAAGQYPVGLDFRPTTGELFMLGYDATTQTGQLYTLNLASAGALPLASGPRALPLGGPAAIARIGFAFDPVTDRIRVTSGITQTNVSFDPTTGLVTTNVPLAYAATDSHVGTTPTIGTVAYASVSPDGTSTAYALDEVNNLLLTFEPAAGTLHTTAPTAPLLEPFGSAVDLAIYYPSATSAGIAYLSTAAIDPSSGYSALYILDLATGKMTSAGSPYANIGPFNRPAYVCDIAVQPASTALATNAAQLAASLSLAPNPLASSTTLNFDLPHATHASL